MDIALCWIVKANWASIYKAEQHGKVCSIRNEIPAVINLDVFIHYGLEATDSESEKGK